MPKKIKPGEKIDVKLTPAEVDLCREHTFMDPNYVQLLEVIPGSTKLLGRYTLDELEDMIGYIVAEANHTGEGKLQNRLDALFERLQKVQDSYDDE